MPYRTIPPKQKLLSFTNHSISQSHKFFFHNIFPKVNSTKCVFSNSKNYLDNNSKRTQFFNSKNLYLTGLSQYYIGDNSKYCVSEKVRLANKIPEEQRFTKRILYGPKKNYHC